MVSKPTKVAKLNMKSDPILEGKKAAFKIRILAAWLKGKRRKGECFYQVGIGKGEVEERRFLSGSSRQPLSRYIERTSPFAPFSLFPGPLFVKKDSREERGVKQ